MTEHMSARDDVRLGLCRSRIPSVSLQADVAGRRRVQDEHPGANLGDPGRFKMSTYRNEQRRGGCWPDESLVFGGWLDLGSGHTKDIKLQ